MRANRGHIIDFDHPRGALLGLMVNMQVIGGAVSLPFAPYAADKYGRRHPIFGGSIIIILGGLLQGCAQNFGMFIAGRFFIGMGAGFVCTAAPPLIGELAYPTHRPIITAVYNTTWVSKYLRPGINAFLALSFPPRLYVLTRSFACSIGEPSLLLGPRMALLECPMTGAGEFPHSSRLLSLSFSS
jgi:MFS family permease